MRTLLIYLGVGIAVVAVLAAADGVRGLYGGVVAWTICLIPLFRWPHRPVANGAADPKIADKWGLLQIGRMLFRLTWVLGVGAVVYQRFGDHLGVGFWIALIVSYQVMLALSVADLFRSTAPASRTVAAGVRASDDPG